MLKNTKLILNNQQGVQALEAIGLAFIGLIAVAVIFSKTKGGFDSASNKLGNTIQAVNNKL